MELKNKALKQVMKLTAIFFGDIRAIASGVIPPTCSCSRADSTKSGRPAGHRGRERERSAIVR